MLNNKQKKYLRALANSQEAWFQIGKDGIGIKMVESISDALTAHELVKIKLLKTCALTPNDAAIELAASTGSDVVQIIGRTVILYRRSKKKLIQLPK